jgi:hypothetical protein
VPAQSGGRFHSNAPASRVVIFVVGAVTIL